jgi:hypothetical protein
MAKILIGYDLNAPDGDYDKLLDALEGFGSYWHCLDSLWLVETRMSISQVRDSLWMHMKRGDEILVIDVTGAPASWVGFNQECSDWLRDNL